MVDVPAFEGMGGKALPFLKAVGFHQSREWFHENKDIYEAHVRDPLGQLVEHLSVRMEEEGLPFRGTRKTSMFRVNRDVRFSKNKDPYNTHCSFVLTRTGTKKDQGFVYLHMSNEHSYVAAGFFGMSGDEMAAMRRRIVDRYDDVKRMLSMFESEGLELHDHGNALKRNPKGFEGVNDPALQTLIRNKHFSVNRDIDNAIVTTPKLADAVIDHAHLCMPLCSFGWAAVDPVREAEALKNAD